MPVENARPLIEKDNVKVRTLEPQRSSLSSRAPLRDLAESEDDQKFRELFLNSLFNNVAETGADAPAPSATQTPEEALVDAYQRSLNGEQLTAADLQDLRPGKNGALTDAMWNATLAAQRDNGNFNVVGLTTDAPALPTESIPESTPYQAPAPRPRSEEMTDEKQPAGEIPNQPQPAAPDVPNRPTGQPDTAPPQETDIQTAGPELQAIPQITGAASPEREMIPAMPQSAAGQTVEMPSQTALPTSNSMAVPRPTASSASPTFMPDLSALPEVAIGQTTPNIAPDLSGMLPTIPQVTQEIPTGSTTTGRPPLRQRLTPQAEARMPQIASGAETRRPTATQIPRPDMQRMSSAELPGNAIDQTPTAYSPRQYPSPQAIPTEQGGAANRKLKKRKSGGAGQILGAVGQGLLHSLEGLGAIAGGVGGLAKKTAEVAGQCGASTTIIDTSAPPALDDDTLDKLADEAMKDIISKRKTATDITATSTAQTPDANVTPTTVAKPDNATATQTAPDNTIQTDPQTDTQTAPDQQTATTASPDLTIPATDTTNDIPSWDRFWQDYDATNPPTAATTEIVPTPRILWGQETADIALTNDTPRVTIITNPNMIEDKHAATDQEVSDPRYTIIEGEFSVVDSKATQAEVVVDQPAVDFSLTASPTTPIEGELLPVPVARPQTHPPLRQEMVYAKYLDSFVAN